MASAAQVAGVAAFAGASFGMAGWSVDQLRRNDWNPRIILSGHAPLMASLPAGVLAGGIGVAAASLLARRMTPELARGVVHAGFAGGAIAGLVGAGVGVATMLASRSIPNDRRHDRGLWAEQVLGWAAPAFVTGAALGSVAGVVASREGRDLLRLMR